MHAEYWSERWQAGRIGFHEAEPNAMLCAHVARLIDNAKTGASAGEAARPRVLVPLSGKSNDLVFLAAQGCEVTGVEFVRQAAEAFFSERGLAPARAEWSGFETLSANGVSIAVGDFFSLELGLHERFDALYDRAALIAVRPEDRERYVATCRAALRPHGRILLVAFALENGAPVGPPFSVDEAEVRRLYDGCSLELLAEADLTASEPRFRERGATRVLEQAWLVTGLA